VALVFNALAVASTSLVQAFEPHQFLIDPVAIAAVILLLLPSVRASFPSRVAQLEEKQATSQN
jgi:hypothetical protein